MKIILEHLEDTPSIVKEKTLKNENAYNNIEILRLDIINLTGKGER